MNNAIDRLLLELPRHGDAPNPCGSFVFSNRTRREVALSPLSVFRSFQVHMPFMDADLVGFLASLPAEMVMEGTLHDDVIAASYPEWSHIPFSTKRKSPVQWRNLKLAWQLVRWFASISGSRCFNSRKILPRMIRAGCDPFYCRDNIESLVSGTTYWTALDSAGRSREETRRTDGPVSKMQSPYSAIPSHSGSPSLRLRGDGTVNLSP